MPTAVVTGANSGIGHAFAQILVKEGYEVVAADLHVGDKIKSLGCQTVQLDVTSTSSIGAFKKQFQNRKLDLLLNIAGQLQYPANASESDEKWSLINCLAGVMSPQEKDSLEAVDETVLTKTFTTNTFGPLMLTQALLQNLLESPHPRLGFMSSRVGSIADNSSGGGYAYRSSKAALNSICKSLAMDLKEKGVVVVIMHPGYTKTGLDPNAYSMAEAVEPEEAAGKLWKVLMGKGIEDTGKFWHREGWELPW